MAESMNAAQLASRKIKSAKGVRGKSGNRALPTAGGFGTNSAQSFTAQSAPSGGGMFGGGVNSSGAFTFSAPVQGISFGSNSETHTPIWGSDTEDDQRSKALAEEAERRNKPFRMADGSAGITSQPLSNTFQRTPLSALGQPNGLGSVSEAVKPNPFQLSRSQSPAVPPFNFGANPAQEQQPASNIFPFGQNTSAAPLNTSFRFGTPPAAPEKPAGNTIPFNQPPSQAQPASTSFGFGSSTATTTIDKPASAIFSFGQTSTNSQQPSTSSTSFNPTPAPVNSFGNANATNFTQAPNPFGQLSQQPTNTGINFSSANPQTAVTNGIFGNSNQQSAAPAKRLFGTSTPRPDHTGTLFGTSHQQSTPTSTIFANLNQAPTSSSSLFGTPQPQPVSSNNQFGVQKELSSSTRAPFGVQEQQPAIESKSTASQQDSALPPANHFGASKDQTAPSGSFFGGKNEPSTQSNTLFGSQQSQSTPANNLFGGATSSNEPFGGQPAASLSFFANRPSATTNNVFGNQQQSNARTSLFPDLNKPTTQVSNEFPSSVIVDVPQKLPAASEPVSSFGSNLQNGGNMNEPLHSIKPASATMQSTPSTPGLVNEAKTETILPSIEVEGPIMNNEALSRLENGTPSRPSANNLFSSVKSTKATNSPAAINTLVNATAATSSSSTSKQPQSRRTASSNEPFVKGNELAMLQNDYSTMGDVPDSVIEERCPKHFNDTQKIQFFAAYRVRSLNKGMQYYIDRAENTTDFSPAFNHYVQRREEILDAAETEIKNLKRKHGEVQGDADNEDSNPKKRFKPSEAVGAVQHVPRRSSPLKTQPVLNSIPSDGHKSPEKMLHPETSKPPIPPKSPEKTPRAETRQALMSPIKKALPLPNGSTTPKVPPPAKSLFPTQQPAVPPSPSPRGKRKAEVQIDKDHPTEEEAIGASHSSKWHTSSVSKPGSATSSVFKSILDSPSQPASGSPEKKMFSLNKTQTADTPRPNPSAGLPGPPLDSGSPFGQSTIAKTSEPGYSPATNIFTKKLSAQSSSLFPVKPLDSNPSGPSPAKTGTNQISVNPFSAGTNSQTSSLYVPKTTPLSSNISETSVPGPFAPTDTSTTSSFFSPQPATAPISMFVPKAASISSAPNPFAPKSGFATANSTSSSDSEAKTITPPTFGNAPVNFLAQFGQKSKKSMADAEAEAMERAKEEDMDSDEDEAEWESKYKEKRAAEKKAAEELAKSKRATFVPGKGFTFDKAQTAPDAEKTATKSIFSQPSAPFSGSNLFAHVNRSGASSPVAASSRASSVFDGAGPPKAATFGNHNIFGHLSDVESGADSGKGNDADDDTSEEDSAESNGQQDNEKKDTTYDPNAEDAASPDSPSTPVEETGPGIASAKKPTAIFNFGTSNSGASTPSTSGGSLFDRISKDAQGNPIRQNPSENKENDGPVPASSFGGAGGGAGINPFANFAPKATAEQNKPAQDNTWKPDSPIRFGASTTSPPTVNITAPTPTKPAPFAGLFGSNAPPAPTGSPFGVFGNGGSAKTSSPASFAGIFGSSGTSKPGAGLFAHLSEHKPAAVGFGFGSTAGSSLLPSTAGSTATSRATSPGGTTDGESNNENIDPEAEHHEQIDLTSGGPGEENEAVLHQVRAKALKFEPSKEAGGKTDWVVKGLGPLRVLKNRETGSSRILLRADPSGTIVLNKGILGNVNYTAAGKTLKLLTAGEGGQGLETWLLQVKTPAGAEELAGVLESHKRKE